MESTFAWKIIKDRALYYYVIVEDLARSIESIELWLNEFEFSYRGRKNLNPQKDPSPGRPMRTKRKTIILRSQYETDESRKISRIRSGIEQESSVPLSITSESIPVTRLLYLNHISQHYKDLFVPVYTQSCTYTCFNYSYAEAIFFRTFSDSCYEEM